MLRRIRNAPSVRLALAVAVLLAVGTAFGLHPEPSTQGPAGDVSGISKVGNAAASHDCQACLTHGAAVASPLAGFVPEAALTSAAILSDDSLPHARLTCRELSGRSPPAHS